MSRFFAALFFCFALAATSDGCMTIIARSVFRYISVKSAMQNETDVDEKSLLLRNALEETVEDIPNILDNYQDSIKEMITPLEFDDSMSNEGKEEIVEATMNEFKNRLVQNLRFSFTFVRSTESHVDVLVDLLNEDSVDAASFGRAFAAFGATDDARRREILGKLLPQEALNDARRFLPEIAAFADRASVSFSLYHFDVVEGAFERKFVERVMGEKEEAKAAAAALEDLNVDIVENRTKFGDKTFPRFLLTKLCPRTEDVGRGCVFNHCGDEVEEEEDDDDDDDKVHVPPTNTFDRVEKHIDLTLKLINEWRQLGSVVECLEEASNVSSRVRCLLGERELEMWSQKEKWKEARRKEFDETRKRNEEAREECRCGVGESPIYYPNGTMQCGRCPAATFKLKASLRPCEACPAELEEGAASYAQCLNSKLWGLKEEDERLREKVDMMESERYLVRKTDWIKLQRRAFGSDYTDEKFGNSFSKWNDFVEGFGSPQAHEFWLGLHRMHRLTRNGSWELMIAARLVQRSCRADLPSKWGWIVYEGFSVGKERLGFPLVLGKRKAWSWGGVEEVDPLQRCNGSRFVTSDSKDGDRAIRGPWWWSGLSSSADGEFCANCVGKIMFVSGCGGLYGADEIEMSMRRA